MFCYLYIFSTLALLFLGLFLGDKYWWLALANSFRYWTLLTSVVFLIDQIFVKNKKQTFLLFIILGIWVFNYVPLNLAILFNKASSKTENSFKIMTFNVLATNDNSLEVQQLINKYHPEILALQEVSQNKAQNIKQEYKHKSFKKINEVHDVVTFTDFLIKSKGNFSTPNGHFEVSQITLPINKTKIYLINLHTLSLEPRNLLDDRTEILDSYLQQKELGREISNYLEREKINPEYTIILGDFNSTENNDLYRFFTKKGFTDGYKKTNIIIPFKSFTFPNNLQSALGRNTRLLPFLRIDYILCGKKIKIHDGEIILKEGNSDHNPVMLDVSVITK